MFVSPLLDCRFVALACLLNRLLLRPTQGTQDTTYVCRMVAHAILTLDDLTNALSGPDVSAKAIGLQHHAQAALKCVPAVSASDVVVHLAFCDDARLPDRHLFGPV